MRAPSGSSATSNMTTPPVGNTIDEIVLRAQQGDVDAFETIYRANSGRVFALCRRMVGDEREARDLVQDIFVRVWQRLPSFRGQSAVGTWLHRLAVNVVLEHLRSAKRDLARFIDDDTSTATLPPARGPSLDAGMDIDRAVALLPTGARTVFVLHDIHGYSHDEISEMT